MCAFQARGVDYSYHIRSNVSVERAIVQGISVHSKHKGEVLFSIGCTFIKAIKYLK